MLQAVSRDEDRRKTSVFHSYIITHEGMMYKVMIDGAKPVMSTTSLIIEKMGLKAEPLILSSS